jgi:membrane-bound lytic murein transglycosylase D
MAKKNNYRLESIEGKRFACFLLFMWLFFQPNALSISRAYGKQPESGDFISLVSSLRIAGPLKFCNEQVPLRNREVRERLEKELLLALWDRPQVILWLKRSSRYLPYIEEMLKKNRMPDDLKYVAIAESALRPHAGSKKGAIGFWQFMADTGRKYGLAVNARIDERRNHFTSTRAAIQYFKELYEKFGSWTLAVAAFNMGEEKLMAEILEQDTHDYYQLYLSLETQRYLLRIISIKFIFADPEKYNFNLTERDYYPPMSFDTVEVDSMREIPIRIIARAAGTHFKRIKDLNPEIRGHYIAAGSRSILIPKGASLGFQNRYKRHLAELLATQKEQIYIVKKEIILLLLRIDLVFTFRLL